MKRLKVIACEVAFREFCFCASQTTSIIDFTFLTKGLHNMGSEKMKETLQNEIDKVDINKYEAILLGYGLCGCGVIGLTSKIPLVIPKAHDCTTFFLGSKERYSEFLKTNTGTYIYSPGWIERNPNKTYEDYVKEFGEENAKYLIQILEGSTCSYDKIVFINTKVGNVQNYRDKLQEKAKSKNWIPLEIEGDNSLLFKFLNGDWNKNDFTVIPPGHKIISTNDDNIMSYE